MKKKLVKEKGQKNSFQQNRNRSFHLMKNYIEIEDRFECFSTFEIFTTKIRKKWKEN